MAGNNNKPKLKRGGNKIKPLRTKSGSDEILTNISDEISMEDAQATVKDLVNYPIEVEEIRFLQRQGKNAGVDMKNEKLIKQQSERDEYNASLKNTDASLYSSVIVPNGSVVIKLFKKPIFELNGFLKPDLIKTKSEGGTGVNYVENRFPYLESGVIVNEAGLGKQFTISEDDTFIGAIATLKIGTRLDKHVYFIDKTDINPTYFDGYITIPAYEIESVLCLATSTLYDDMTAKCTGKTGNFQLQTKLNADTTDEEDDTTK